MSKDLENKSEFAEVSGLAAIQEAVKGAGMFSIGMFAGTIYGSLVATAVAYFVLEMATY